MQRTGGKQGRGAEAAQKRGRVVRGQDQTGGEQQDGTEGRFSERIEQSWAPRDRDAERSQDEKSADQSGEIAPVEAASALAVATV